LGKLLLSHQPEQLVDDTVLGEDVPPGDPLELAFAEHKHGFIALDDPLHGVKGAKSSTRIHPMFHKPMILLHHIIYVLDLRTCMAS
jgi:hypothetical protein